MKIVINGESFSIPVIASNKISTIEIISREEYDALLDHPSTTLYFIQG